MAVAAHAVAQGARERRVGHAADAGGDVGRDVRRVELAGRDVEHVPARERDADALLVVREPRLVAVALRAVDHVFDEVLPAGDRRRVGARRDVRRGHVVAQVLVRRHVDREGEDERDDDAEQRPQDTTQQLHGSISLAAAHGAIGATAREQRVGVSRGS